MCVCRPRSFNKYVLFKRVPRVGNMKNMYEPISTESDTWTLEALVDKWVRWRPSFFAMIVSLTIFSVVVGSVPILVTSLQHT